MIVRILGDRQYRVDSDLLLALEAIDRRLDDDLAGEEPAEFASHLAEMHRLVRAHGSPLADDELLPSDVVLPAEGSTLAEVRALLTQEGLVPG